MGPIPIHKGYSSGYGFASMPPGFSSVMKNVRIESGAIVPIWGQFIANNATLGAAIVYGLTHWFDTVNSKDALIAICDQKVWIADVTAYSEGTQATFTDRTGSVAIAYYQGRYSFDSLNNILIGVGDSAGGTSPPFKVTAFNATAAVLGGSPPYGDAVKRVNNFLFIGRQLASSTTKSRVSWSNVGDPETWSALNFVEFNKNDGLPVTALGAIGSDLYIFKPTSIGRLSTSTQVISGSSALGPLTTVIDGIGCCGPLALGNLPNGNIIFVGSDGHVYIFDGSIILDISKQPYPNVNVFDEGDTASYGLRSGVPDRFVVLKVWRGINQVWISFNTTATGTPTTWVYDITNGKWDGWLTDSYGELAPTSYATVPGAGYLSNASEYLFIGTNNGNVIQQNYSKTKYATFAQGSPDESKLSISVRIGGDGLSFMPRSVCFELDRFSASSALFFSYKWDNIDNGGAIALTLAGSGVPFRNIVPLVLATSSAAFYPVPSILTLTWKFLGSGTNGDYTGRINSIWLSDEVMR